MTIIKLNDQCFYVFLKKVTSNSKNLIATEIYLRGGKAKSKDTPQAQDSRDPSLLFDPVSSVVTQIHKAGQIAHKSKTGKEESSPVM